MTTNSNYTTYAFISYSHRDMGVAKWLQKNLEAFKLPTEVHNDIEANSRYLRPIFRDQSDQHRHPRRRDSRDISQIHYAQIDR